MPRTIIDLAARGDLVHRDVYFRKLYSVGSTDASSEAYVDYNAEKTKVSEVKTTVSSGAGQWSVYLRNPTSNAMEGNSRVSVTPAETSLDSDVTKIKGALTVSNFASFENDLQVTTGSVEIGQNLIVDGNTQLGNELTVSNVAANGTATMSAAALTFGQDGTNSWRLKYDPVLNGLAFEENTGTTQSPNWVRRFQFNS